MPKVDVNGSKFFYALSGAPQGPVVVFSNSLGTTLEMWRSQLAALEQKFRVLRYDMRGHGQSDLRDEPCSIADLGRDVVGLLGTLGIEKVHFCGLSIGGVIGQWLGANFPERLQSLVLCNTAAKIGVAETWNQRIADVAAKGMAPITDAALQRWFTAGFASKHPEAVAPFRAMLLANDPRGYSLLCGAIRDMDQRGLVEGIRVPTCVIAGKHDPVTTVADAEFLQSKIAGATLVSLDAAHISNVEAAEAFNAALFGFLGDSA
jgi:3-oxoadipate enol-lactonase